MSVKTWLQKNSVFDRDLVKIFPKYGINEPEKDLKNLTPENWKKIQAQLKKDKAKEIKDNAAKARFQKKLTKIEKLWRAKRPKKKVKAPKMLSLFDDKPPTTNESNGSSSKKKNKNKKANKPKSPKKATQSAAKKQNKTEQNKNTSNKLTTDDTKEDWDQYDTLKLSDNEAAETRDNNENKTYKMPALNAQGSVVDMLLSVGDDMNDQDEEKKEAAATQKITITNVSNENENENENESKDETDEWKYDFVLKLSDDDIDENENENEEKQMVNETKGNELFVPMYQLKTQGSVVDMLMAGPYSANKAAQKPITNKLICVTPPAPNDNTDTVEKGYNIAVSNGDTKDTKPAETVEASLIAVDENKADDKKEQVKKVRVSMNAAGFVYNESRQTYSVSLRGCKLMKSDFVAGTITFEIKKGIVNVDESDQATKGMDDKYIASALDEIHRNNPDTETDD